MSDLVEKLRDTQYHPIFSGDLDFRKAAADEIERLQAELREVKEAFDMLEQAHLNELGMHERAERLLQEREMQMVGLVESFTRLVSRLNPNYMQGDALENYNEAVDILDSLLDVPKDTK